MSGKDEIKRELGTRQVVDLLGQELVDKLATISSTLPGPLYMAGGTVRDLLIGRVPADIDLTVVRNAKKWAAELARLTGGAYVPLGRDEDAARVVWQGRDIDFSSFREGAGDIEEELRKRDLTVNSLAVSIGELVRGETGPISPGLAVIDPVGGVADLNKKIIRVTYRDSFQSDPLRLLRVFRFAATLGFAVDEETFSLVSHQKEWIARPAAERVAHELDLIMRSERVHETVCALVESGLLFNIIPELHAGVGMEQPASHHLDVFDHCLATLHCMVKVQRQPARYFARYGEVLEEYVAADHHLVQLRKNSGDILPFFWQADRELRRKEIAPSLDTLR